VESGRSSKSSFRPKGRTRITLAGNKSELSKLGKGTKPWGVGKMCHQSAKGRNMHIITAQVKYSG